MNIIQLQNIKHIHRYRCDYIFYLTSARKSIKSNKSKKTSEVNYCAQSLAKPVSKQ